MKVIRRSLIFISILLAICMPITVMAAAYQATFVVSETNGTTYAYLPVMVTANSTWLAANGFMTASALDTRVQTLDGFVRPHLVADDKILSALPVAGSTQNNLYFTTGNTSLTSMDIITGYNGFVTIADAAALEPGNNFEFNFTGVGLYDDGNILYKDNAITVDYQSEDLSAIFYTGDYAASNPTVAATNNGTNAATQNHTVNLPANVASGDLLIVMFGCSGFPAITYPAGWTLIDENGNSVGTARQAIYYKVADGTEGASITVTTNADQASAYITLRITDYSGTPVSTTAAAASDTPNPPNLAPAWGNEATLWISSCLYVGGGDAVTVTVYPANYADNQTNAVSGTAVGVGLATRDLTAANDDPGAFTISHNKSWHANTIGIAPAWETLSLTLPNIANGDYDIDVSADGVNWFMLSLDGDTSWDGVNSARIALGGLSVSNNANNWILMSNATPYLGAYEHSVGGARVVYYNPITIISGTTLPDREGAAQNGVITWGANPAGVTVTLGSLIAITQPSPGQTLDEEAIDILPAVSSSDWYTVPDVTGTLLTNPLRPFVTILSDTTSMTEMQAWRLLGLVFCVFWTVAAAVAVNNHLLIAGMICGACIGLMVALTIFPLWAVVFIIAAVAAGVVGERSPSL